MQGFETLAEKFNACVVRRPVEIDASLGYSAQEKTVIEVSVGTALW